MNSQMRVKRLDIGFMNFYWLNIVILENLKDLI